MTSKSIKKVKCDRCISIIKTKKNIMRRCKRREIDNKLCRQHYNKTYIEKKKETIVSEILNDIIRNVCNEKENRCCICLENIEDQISINPSCCNRKQYYHFQCLEKHLCYYSDKFCCPICKINYTTEIIDSSFNENQKQMLFNRLDNSIKYILTKIKRNFSDFKRKFKIINRYIYYLEQNRFIPYNQNYRYTKLIQNKKNRLMEIYETICKDQLLIENQLTKINKIIRNIPITLKIDSDMKSFKSCLRNMLEELDIL